MDGGGSYCCNASDPPGIIRAGKQEYNAETYIGNWYEETVRNTHRTAPPILIKLGILILSVSYYIRDQHEKLSKYTKFYQNRRRECGDLTIQRTQTMVDLLLKPIKLTCNENGLLQYGDTVQIVTPGPSCKLAQEVFPFKRNYCNLAHLVLSAAVPPMAIDHAPHLNTDSIISVSPLLFPVVRNSFIIEHPDCPTIVGGIVNYGDVFRIRAFDTQHFPMYLFSNPAIRLHAEADLSAKPKVRFSDIKLAETLWCAHPLDPEDKLRMDLGVPVRLKKRLLIRHNQSYQNLSWESNFPVLTYFGDEYEVTVDTKLDLINREKFKKPTFENEWYFDTDRQDPRPSPCDKEFEKQADFSAKINANMVHKSAAQEAKEQEDPQREAEECDDNTNGISDLRQETKLETNARIPCQSGQKNSVPGTVQSPQDVLEETKKMLNSLTFFNKKKEKSPYCIRTFNH